MRWARLMGRCLGKPEALCGCAATTRGYGTMRAVRKVLGG